MSDGRSVGFLLGSRVRREAMSRDPYPVLKTLQEQEPITWVAYLETWFVTGRADCLAILLDSATLSVASASSLLEDTPGQTMLSTDGARQRQLRQPFNGPFASKGVQTHMAAPIATYDHDLVDAFGTIGRIDLKTAFSDRLALWTVMTVIGLPIHDFSTVRGWFTDIAHALGNFARDPQVRGRGRAASAACGAYVTPHLQRMRNEPGDSVLATVASSGKLSDEEMLSAARAIVFGGLETTAAMLTNTLWVLLSHPDQLEVVRANAELLPQAIEEALRWEPPVQSCTRFVTHPIVMRGVELAPGEMVQCMVGLPIGIRSISRIRKSSSLSRANTKDHLFSFATGKHFCLGPRSPGARRDQAAHPAGAFAQIAPGPGTSQ